MAEDQAERRRQALLAMQSQMGQAMPVSRPPEQMARDLSQMRPVVQNAVGEQEKKAEMVVSATWKLFMSAIG